MNVKYILWHAFSECETDRLANGKAILTICKGTTKPEFQEFRHRSNVITIPADARMVRHIRGKRLPQEYHFNWCTWIKAILLVPTGFAPTRFALCIYIPEARELRICSEMRRADSGLFALRLTAQDQQVFLIAERQVTLRPGGIFGGIEKADRQLPEKTDLY